MDLLSQVFDRRDLAVRRGLFFSLTALMLLTTLSKTTDSLGWWEKAVAAPEVSYSPQMIAPSDHKVEVQVRSEQRLVDLEISVDAGVNWVPASYLIGSRVIFEEGQSASFTFSLQAGHLAHFFSAREFPDRKIRSLLLRGVTSGGLNTAPKSLVFLYKNTSVEGLLSKL